jgi:tetratricopeptide (TPR) repeat protein
MQVGEAAKDATALTQLGDDHRDRSEYEQAIAFYEQALALYREVQDRAGEGRTLTRLGQAYYALSQYKQALALSEEALAMSRPSRSTANSTTEGGKGAHLEHWATPIGG